MRGENIRNLTILLLLTFGLGQDSLQNFVDIDQPLSQKRGHCVSKEMRQNFNAKDILISGDFNMDRRMDENPTKSKFSKKGETRHNNFFDGILDLGFHDCLRKYHSLPMRTYRHNRGIYPWELDHMFVTPDLYERLKSIDVFVDDSILKLSDHNPIVANFSD